MVENTLEQKKKTTIWKNTILQIAAGAVIMLAVSVYCQLTGVKDFFGTPIRVPDLTQGIEVPLGAIQSQAQNGKIDPYRHFTTPDGYLSLDYPSAYTDGQETVKKIAGDDGTMENTLLVAYKTSMTDINPVTLTVAKYNATTTEEVIGQIERVFKEQRCQFDIVKSDIKSDESWDIYDSSYKCGDDGGLSYWRAQTAIAQNGNIFYTVTAATINKNWDNAALEINSIFNSMSVNAYFSTPADEETESAKQDNQFQNDEPDN